MKTGPIARMGKRISLLLAATVALCIGTPARAQDVGLVTKLQGGVTYADERNPPASLEAFMKVRLGDHLQVAAGATVQVVYFQSNRQELWKGPVELLVGEVESRLHPASPPAVPEVRVVPAGTSRGMQQVPVLLRRAGLVRVGGVQLRGSGVPRGASPPLSAAQRADLAAAQEAYGNWRERAGDDDITPELYLLGVLAGLEQYEAMAPVLADALRRRPEDATLLRLKEWAARTER